LNLKENKMAGIADLIFNQMQTAGKPRTATSVTTAKQSDEPMDLGSLGLLLYFLLNKSSAKLGTTGVPMAGGRGLEGLIGQAPGAMTGQGGAGQMDPISLILSMFGGARGMFG
jgi:hypothetical protein